MNKTSTVESYLEKHNQWKSLLFTLRTIALSTGMEEAIKWGTPVYVSGGKNIAGIAAFKSHVALWFYQGAFLADPEKVLINAQEGKTKALRQWRFTAPEEVNAAVVKAYMEEAIRNSREGKEIKPVKEKIMMMTDEFGRALKNNAALKACFEELTPFRQREFAEYIAEARRSETRMKRLDKIIPMILEKKGLNDKYR